MEKQYFRKGNCYRRSLASCMFFMFTILSNFGSPGIEPNGYRVQIFASKSNIEAIKIKSEYETKHNHENLIVYIEFIDNWYKVQLGDYQQEEDARILCQKVKMRGYPDAWVVHTVINTEG